MYELFGKSKAGKVLLWRVEVQGDEVIVTHGQNGGKLTSKSYRAKPKNLNKVNETTAEHQAVIEAAALVDKQKKRGYFEKIEDAVNFQSSQPMLAQNFNEHEHKVRYNCYVQPKLNGMRLKVVKKGGVFTGESKAGLDSPVPPHWIYGLKMLDAYGFVDNGLDGEIYAGLQSEGGLSLQEITSAYRKYNENTAKLEYHIYDIPVEGETFDQRAVRLGNLYYKILILEKEGIKLPIKVVWTGLVERPEEANRIYQYLVDQGYEGMMYRNADGVYEFGTRSYDLLKRKAFVDFEAEVLSVEEDKNSCGVLTCRTINGTHIGSVFKVLMRIDADEVNYRDYNNALALVGKTITVEADEYSDSGTPTKPRGTRVRNVNSITKESIDD